LSVPGGLRRNSPGAAAPTRINKFRHFFSQASYSAAPEKCQLHTKRL
jgi:hypothetical protein